MAQILLSMAGLETEIVELDRADGLTGHFIWDLCKVSPSLLGSQRQV